MAAALPVIDVAALCGDDGAAKRRVARRLRDACMTHGFFYTVGHGVPAARLADVLAQCRRLFAQPTAAKRAIAGSGAPGARGYATLPGRDRNGGMLAVAKEEYYLGRDVAPGSAEANRWPEGLSRFRAAMTGHFAAMNDLAARLMAGLALSLDLPQDHFAAFCTDPIAALRLVRYAPEAEGAGAHTDFGSLTLLVQDDIGGLEVRDRAGGWIAAPPIAGTIVVNIGDLFERWTNRRYRSAAHRVVNHAGAERVSVPFFLTGAADHPIACLPSCLASGETPHDPPTTVARHLQARFAALGA